MLYCIFSDIFSVCTSNPIVVLCVLSGWLVTLIPESIAQLTLVDPVSLLLGLPDVAFNFLYKPPRTFIEYCIYYAAASEVTVSHTLHRHFWWYRNALWLEDLSPHLSVVIAVSGQDSIVNAVSLHEYASRCQKMRMNNAPANGCAPISVVDWPTYSHAQFLTSSRAMEELVSAMNLNRNDLTTSTDK